MNAIPRSPRLAPGPMLSVGAARNGRRTARPHARPAAPFASHEDSQHEAAMTEEAQPSLRAARRRWENATVERAKWHGLERKAGRTPTATQAIEKPVWEAVRDVLRAYTSDQSKPFPPEIAHVLAGTLDELIDKGKLPTTWRVLLTKGRADPPPLVDCRQTAVAFFVAIKKKGLAKKIKKLRGKPDQEFQWPNLASPQYQGLREALKFDASVAGMAKAFGVDTSTIYTWNSTEKYLQGAKDSLRLWKSLDVPLPAFIWEMYGKAAAAYREIGHNRPRH